MPGCAAAAGRHSRACCAGGDLIVHVGERPIANPNDLADAIGALKPGDEVRVEYFRGNERRTATVKLGTRPQQANRG